MKRTGILIIAIGLAMSAQAQTEADALRFSQTANYGTARSAAMGGAFGALGGDISSMSSNPAGIGVFRKHEFNFTPLINFTKTSAGDRSVTDNSFQIGTLGGVISFYNPNFDWRGFNFGISYTNLNNFNRKNDQAVYNSGNSLTDVWAAQSTGYISDKLNPYTTKLAYDTYLINPIAADTFVPVLTDGELVNQYKMIKEDGYQGEIDFSFGTNYKDKLYLGMTIGMQTLYYKMNSTYTELASLDSELDFYNFNEYSKISGTGVNFKFGAIYRPIPELRIGAAIHTPTWYSMTQSIENSIYSQFNTPDNTETGREYDYYDVNSSDGPDGYYYGPYKFDYDLKTPWRAIFSVATVLKQKAILSVDYEYIDYASAKFSEASDGVSYQDVNSGIKYLYQGGHNLRAGAEYRVNSTFSLRGGYSYQGSPYKDNSSYNIQSVSGGIGLNFGPAYCDAAYSYRFSKDNTRFYDYDGIQAESIHNKYVNNEVRITLGVKF